MNIMAKQDTRGYALDLSSPCRHLRTALDTAPDGAVSLRAVGQGYSHIISGDLSRVKRHELKDMVASDKAAEMWLIEEAARQLAPWLDREDRDGDVWVKLKAGKTTDQLRWDGRPIHPVVDPHKELGDLFNPMQAWADNIRAPAKEDDLTELTDSMRVFGWVRHLPAFKDERGVVLVGHRRLKVAEDLNIEPVIEVIDFSKDFGHGDAADAQRFALAVASNLGGRGFSIKDRRYIAQRLYGDQGWSMEKIAEKLRVSAKTISLDLQGFLPEVKTSRPKGGRPKGRSKAKIPEDKEKTAIELFNAGATEKEVTEKLGVSSSTVHTLKRENAAREEGRAAGLAEAKAAKTVAPKLPRKICPCCGGTGFVAEGGSDAPDQER